MFVHRAPPRLKNDHLLGTLLDYPLFIARLFKKVKFISQLSRWKQKPLLKQGQSAQLYQSMQWRIIA